MHRFTATFLWRAGRRVEVLDVGGEGDGLFAQPLAVGGVEVAVHIVLQHFGENCENLILLWSMNVPIFPLDFPDNQNVSFSAPSFPTQQS